MKTLGIIPARGGSKGIPRKALHPLAGKPMLLYAVEAALNSTRLDRVILSTDDAEIADVGRAAGAEVPFIRPAALATDTATLDEVVEHLLEWLETNEGYIPDAFAILQSTTPLRTSKHIDDAFALLDASEVNSVVAVSEPTEHPSDMVTFEEGGVRPVISGPGLVSGVQRQAYGNVYYVSGIIYLTKTQAYREQGTRFAVPSVPLVLDALESIDIDTPQDLVIAELLLLVRSNETRKLRTQD